MKPLNLVVVVPGQADQLVSLPLGESDRALFENYISEFNRMVAAGPFRSTMPCKLSFSGGVGKPPSWTVQVPSDDDFAIVLHRLRPLILSEEPASFERVAGALGRLHKDTPVVRAFMKERWALWRGEKLQTQIPIRVEATLVNDDRLLINWLNAYEYHRDADKAGELAKLRAGMPEEIFKWMIVSLAFEKVDAIEHVAKMAALHVGKAKELRLEGATLRVLSDGPRPAGSTP